MPNPLNECQFRDVYWDLLTCTTECSCLRKSAVAAATGCCSEADVEASSEPPGLDEEPRRRSPSSSLPEEKGSEEGLTRSEEKSNGICSFVPL